MLITGQLVKETLLVGTFNIVFTSINVGSDAVIIFTLFRDEFGNHLGFMAMLLVPFLLNYLNSWLIWYRIDKRKQITWLACVFNVYPQMRAANVIRALWSDPKTGISKKRKFEREVPEGEVFLESTFATFALTFMLRRLDGNFFLFTLITSLLTAGLGMAKTLKVGPCRILPDDKGFLDGLLSLRFLLIFIACLATLIGKVVLFVVFSWCPKSILSSYQDNPYISSALALSLVTLPGLITGVIFIRHRSLLKTFLIHPSMLLLPALTFF